MKLRAILAILIILGALPAKDQTLYILHTNNSNGTLENCYCPEHPYGALEKRAAFVETWLAEHPNTIIVDAGDLVSLSKRSFKDSLATEAYRLIPYDALLPGDQELTHPDNVLFPMLARTGAPIIATNLTSPAIPGLQREIIIERAGLKIGILGIVGPAALRFYPAEVKAGIKLKDVGEILDKKLKSLKQKTDIIIVLTHQGYDHDVKLAANYPGIDIIIGAHSQTSLKTAQTVQDVLIGQAGKEGYYVGIMEVQLAGDGTLKHKAGRLEAMTLEMPDHPRVMQLIELFEKKTGIVNRRKLDHD